MEQFEIELKALAAEQKTFIAKAQEELKNAGNTSTETKSALEAVVADLKKVQVQADAIDLKLNDAKFSRALEGEGAELKRIGNVFTDSNVYKEAKANDFMELRNASGRLRAAVDTFLERKTTITTSSGLTSGTTGIQMPMRLPNITILAQQALRIRDLMTVRTMTTGNSFDWVQQLARTNAASPQVEGSAKAESTYTWNSLSGTVKTIAHFTNVSRQAIDDVPWVQNMINSELMYGLLLKEEQEILSGDGTGQHLNGLITQATARAATYDATADTKLDVLRHAKLQARIAGLGTFAPDGYALNPVDLQKIELLKDETGGANKGRYIVGDPKSGPQVTLLWGLPVVESDSITAGTFLVGSFSTGAELIDRMQSMIEISYEHSTNFTQNIATILCEERIGLAVRRPGSFITGSY